MLGHKVHEVIEVGEELQVFPRVEFGSGDETLNRMEITEYVAGSDVNGKLL
jgi:hypothetical protein